MRFINGFYILVIVAFLRVAAPPGADPDPLLTYKYICDANTDLCYQAFADQQSHVDAWFRCHSFGMHLAMPKTDEEREFIATSITGGVEHEGFWIGLTDLDTEMEWTWMDMELADSNLPWRELKDSKGHEDCVEVAHDGWKDARCEQTKPFLCQSYREGCSRSSSYLFGDRCYRVITGDYRFSVALCTGMGGTLAMPKTDNINSYLDSINYEGKDMWIGLRGDVDLGFLWLDGSLLQNNQSNFIANPPKAALTEGVFMTAGGWDGSSSADEVKPSYACEIRLVIDCGDVLISNGYNISGNTSLHANHTYACKAGYTPDHRYTVCTSNEMWVPTPKCIRDCGNHTIENGDTIHGLTTVGVNHTYTCAQGFSAVPAYTVCKESGTWTPVPQCLRDCGTYNIENGGEISGNTIQGASHAYTCAEGYSASYPYTVCQSNGSWVPTPICTFDGCKTLAVSNGHSIPGTSNLGTNHSVQCSWGYASEETWTLCSNIGVWEPLPACYLDPNITCLCVPVDRSNLTLEEKIQYYINMLTVEKESLSKTHRKLTSADDDRKSAKSIGFSVICLSDMIELVRFISKKRHAHVRSKAK